MFRTPTSGSGRKAAARRHARLTSSVVEFLEQRQLLSTRPTVIEAAFDFEGPDHKLRFRFDQDISKSLSAADLAVQRWGSTSLIAASNFQLQYQSATNTATFTYNGNFTDGQYRAILSPFDVSNLAGDRLPSNYVLDFKFLTGDVNNDGVVGGADYDIIDNNYGQPGTFSQGDLDYSGTIDDDDLSVWEGNEGVNLPTVGGTPTNFSISRDGQGRPLLSWTDNTSSESFFFIQRSTTGLNKDFSLVGTVAANTTTWLDSSAPTNAMYWYRVMSYASSSVNRTLYTAKATVTRPVPAVPTAIVASAVQKNDLTVSWTHSGDNATAFDIALAKGTGPFVHRLRTSSTARTAVVDRLEADTFYRVQVRAVGESAESNYAESTQVRTQTGAPAAINATVDASTAPHKVLVGFDQAVLSTTVSQSDHQIFDLARTLSLTASQVSAEYFAALRSAAFTLGGTLRTDYPAGVLNDGNYESLYLPGGVENAAGQAMPQEYLSSFFFYNGDFNQDRVVDQLDADIQSAHFNVSGNWSQGDFNYDGLVNSSDFSLLAARFGTTLSPLPGSANQLVADGASATTIRVQWSAPASLTGILGYKIWRSVNGVDFGDPIATVADPNAVEWMDGTGSGATGPLEDGSKYYYRVRPYTSGGTLETTNKDWAVTVLPAPTDLSVSNIQHDQVTLAWSDNSENEAGFEVLYSADGEQWLSAGIASANAESFVVAGLEDATSHSFKVKAVNVETESAESLVATATTKLQPPSNLLISADQVERRVALQWRDNSNREAGYIIERRPVASSTWELVASVDPSTTFFEDVGVAPNTQYEYRVTAAGPSVNSEAILKETTSGGYTAFYADDFRGSGSEIVDSVGVTWSSTTTGATDAGYSYLGTFGDESLRMSVGSLPTIGDCQLYLAFDLMILGPWYGSTAGNNFAVIVDEAASPTFETSFATLDAQQSYPAQLGGTLHEAGTGATDAYRIDYQELNPAEPEDPVRTMGNVYHMRIPIEATGGGSMTIDLAAEAFTSLVADGAWAIDNVVLYKECDPPPSFGISVDRTRVSEGDGTVTVTRSGSISGSTWSVDWGDGSNSGPIPSTESTRSHTYTDGLRVNNVKASSGTDVSNTVSVVVRNVAPVLNVPTSIAEYAKEKVRLSLSATDAGNDTIQQWAIGWGDNTGDGPSSGATALFEHTYPAAKGGRYFATAIAQDEDGIWRSDPIPVDILKIQPVASIDGPTVAVAGESFSVTVNAFQKGGLLAADWVVDWGDGSGTGVIAQPQTSSETATYNLSHAYSKKGNYTLQIRYTDLDGETWQIGALPIRVLPISSATLPLLAAPIGDRKVALAWKGITSGTVDIEYSSDGGENIDTVTAVSAAPGRYTVEGLDPNTSYLFRLKLGSQTGSWAGARTLIEGIAYQNDFESVVGTEWTHSGRSATPLGQQKFLGEFHDLLATQATPLELALGDIDGTNTVDVTFDLFALRSWDGSTTPSGPNRPDYGPDHWFAEITAGTEIATSFSNHLHKTFNTDNHQQHYPHQLSGSTLNNALTGSFQNPFVTVAEPGPGEAKYGWLGYKWLFTGNTVLKGVTRLDSVYKIHLTIEPPSVGSIHEDVVLKLWTDGLQARDDESWGIDNVVVRTAPTEDPNVVITSSADGPIAEGSRVSFTALVNETGNQSGDTPVEYDFEWEVTALFPNSAPVVGMPPEASIRIDGTQGVLSFEAEDNGTYVVKVKATLKDEPLSVVGEATTQISVTNLPPVAEIEFPGDVRIFSSGVPTENFKLKGPFTPARIDPSRRDTHSFLWSVLRNGQTYELPTGTPTTGSEFAFTPATGVTGDAFVVKCIATDDDGAQSVFLSEPFAITSGTESVYGSVNYGRSSPGIPEEQMIGVRVYDDLGGRVGRWDLGEPYVYSGGAGSGGGSAFHFPGLSLNTVHNLRVEVPDNVNDTDWVTTTVGGTASSSPVAILTLTTGHPSVTFHIDPKVSFDTEPDTSHEINPQSSQHAPVINPYWRAGDVVFSTVLAQDDYATYLLRRSAILERSGAPIQINNLGEFAAIGEELFPHVEANGDAAFDRNGNLLFTAFQGGAVNRLNADGFTTDLGVINLDGPHSIEYDAGGNVYVSANAFFNLTPTAEQHRRSGIYKFDKNGSLLAWLARGMSIGEFALAPDQHTIIFTHGRQRGEIHSKQVYRLDSNTGVIEEIAYFPAAKNTTGVVVTGSGQDRSTWRIYVLTDHHINELDWEGNLLRSMIPIDEERGEFFEAPPVWSGLTHDSVPGYVWASKSRGPGAYDSGLLHLIELSSGTRVASLKFVDTIAWGYHNVNVYRPDVFSGAVGNEYTYTAHATDWTDDWQPALAERFVVHYSFDELPDGTPIAPAGATIDPLSGVVRWTPTQLTGSGPGARFKIVAQRKWRNSSTPVPVASENSRDTQEFWVNVTSSGANNAPTIANQHLTDGRVGLSYSARVLATDSDRDQISYSVVAGNAQIDEISGLLTFLPRNAGTETVRIRVQDGRGGTAEADVLINVLPALDASSRDPVFVSGITPGQQFSAPAGRWFTVDPIVLNDEDLEDRFQLALRQTQGPNDLIVRQKLQDVSGIGQTTVGRIDWWAPLDMIGQSVPVTLEVSDGRGGFSEIRFDINITSPLIVIDDVRVLDGITNKDTQRVLAVAVADQQLLETADFEWSWVPDVNLKTPVIVGYQNRSSVEVTFAEAGTYEFRVKAKVRIGEVDHFSAEKSVFVTVASTIKRIVPSLSATAASYNQTVDWLSVSLYDQFQQAVESLPTGWDFHWSGPWLSDITTNFSPTITATGSGIQRIILHKSPTEPVMETSIRVEATDDAVVVFPNAGVFGVEGESSQFGGTSQDFNNYLATFVNVQPASGQAPSAFAITIDWGDGTSSSGFADAVSLPPNSEGPNHYRIRGSHRYGVQGLYEPSITVTDTANAGRGATFPSDEDDPSVPVTARSAPLVATPVRIAAVNGRELNDVLLRFVDPAPVTSDVNFTALIQWGDRKVTNPDRKGHDYWIRRVGQNDVGTIYELAAKHSYDGVGKPPARVTIYEEQPQLAALPVQMIDVPLDVTVGATDLTTPATPTVVVRSHNVIQVGWFPNPHAWGYQLTRIKYNAAGAELSRTILPIASPVGSLATVSNPFTDTDLQPGTWYGYTVTAVDQFLNASNPSPVSIKHKTPEQLTIPAPQPPDDLVGRHLILIDPQSNRASEGVKLSWNLAATPAGYALGSFGYKIDRASSETPTEWIPLFDDNQVLDPLTNLEAGRVVYFDEFAGGYPNDLTYTYRVYAVDMEGTKVSPSYGELEVGPDSSAPTAPTGLAAASYPDAMQLTWDDRPVEDDEDFAGWNVYRDDMSVHGTNWVRLNDQLVFEELGFNDYTAVPSTPQVSRRYEYYITAVDVFGHESGPSVTIQHRRSIAGEPTGPSSLTATPSSTTAAFRINLQWAPVVPEQHQGHTGDALQGYHVYRASSATAAFASYTKLTTEPITDRTYLDQLPSQGEYYYAVTAIDQDGDESRPSFVVGDTGQQSGTGPAAPTGMVFVDVTRTSVKVQWNSAANVTYRVFRRLASGDPAFEMLTAPVVLMPDDKAEIEDLRLSPGRTYEFKIVAVNSVGDYSTETTDTITTTAATAQAPTIGFADPAPATGGGTSDPLLITADRNVIGYAFDLNDDALTWRLVLHPADVADADTSRDILLNKGTEKLGTILDPVALGRIKPGLVVDGLYTLKLIAQDSNNSTSTAILPQPIQIKSELKLGNFTLPVVDLQIDGPNGQSISVTRIYDSLQANEKGDFGYGWRLDIAETAYQTTGRKSPNYGNRLALKFGDLVYVTLPGEGQHVFAFTPRPNNYNASFNPDPMSWMYEGAAYAPMFVAVDGSNAILTVPRDGSDDDLPFFLQRKETGEFIYADPGGEGEIPFHPSHEQFGNELRIRTANGTQFFVNAETGQLQYSVDSVGLVTNFGDRANNSSLLLEIQRYETGAKTGLIQTVQVVDASGSPIGNPVSYEYNDALDLVEVTTQDGEKTGYAYADPVRAHFLTKVTDPRGVEVLKATYSRATGQLEALKDPLDKTATVSTSGFNGSSATSGVTDPTGQATQFIYDNHGNVTREIRRVTGPGGTVDKYIVTVREYLYPIEVSPRDMMDFGISNANSISGMTEYDPIELPGSSSIVDLQTKKGRVRRSVSYYTRGDLPDVGPVVNQYTPNTLDPDFRQVKSETVHDESGRARTTEYKHYKLGKPQLVIDADGKETVFKYGEDGLLEWTANALGEGTSYTYLTVDTSEGETKHAYAPREFPGALVKDTHKVTVTNPKAILTGGTSVVTPVLGEDHYLQQNDYYDETAPIGSRWKLKKTIDAAGITQAFAYDHAGNQVVSATYWRRNQGSSGYSSQPWLLEYTDDRVQELGLGAVHRRWFVSRTKLDGANRVIETSQQVFEDVRTANGTANRELDWHLVRHADGTSTVHLDEQQVNNENNDNPGRGERILSRTHYDALGKVSKTENEYSTSLPEAQRKYTTNHYDDRGNLVETINPDGTKTVSVHDTLGRVILSVDRFADSQSTTPGTRTIYDDLGRVAETHRLADVSVTIEEADIDGVFRVTDVSDASIVPDGEPAAPDQPGTWKYVANGSGAASIATTKNFYDQQGRVVESVNPDGLRTGTLYFDDGRVRMTGRIKEPTGGASRLTKSELAYRLDPRLLSDDAAGDFLTSTQTEHDAYGATDVYLNGPFHVAGEDNEADAIRLTVIDMDTQESFELTHVVTSTDAALVRDGLVDEINDGVAGWPIDSATLLNGVIKLTPIAGARYIAFTDIFVDPEAQNGPRDRGTTGVASPTRSTSTRDARGYWTVQLSDATGRPTETIHADGTSTRTLYSVPGEDVDDYEVSQLSETERELFSITQQVVNIDEQDVITSNFYDFAGRLVAVVMPDPDDFGVGNNGPLGVTVWRYRYDPAGNQAAIIDPRDLGMSNQPPTPSTLPDRPTVMIYDELGQRLQRYQANGAEHQNWKYDNKGRMFKHSTGGDPGTFYIYDESPQTGGRVMAERRYNNANGIDPLVAMPNEETSYQYEENLLGRRISVTEKVKEGSDLVVLRSTGYGYDAVTGAVNKVVNPEGTLHHAFEPGTGRLIHTWTGTATSVSNLSNIITRTDHTYDVFGRLETTALVRTTGTAVSSDNLTRYSYDANGSLDTVKTGLSTATSPVDDVYVQTAYTYDRRNRLILEEVRKFNGATVKDVASFDYNATGMKLAADGQREGVVEKRFDNNGVLFSTTTIDWKYDHWNRLIEEDLDHNLENTVAGDPQNDDHDYRTEYHLDAVGNRELRRVDELGDGDIDFVVKSSGHGLTQYDRLEREETFAGATPTGTPTTTTIYSYDASGSIESKDTDNVIVTYEYDLRQRVTSATSGGTVYKFEYDAEGRRVKETKTEVGDITQVELRVIDGHNPTGYSQVLELRVGDDLQLAQEATPTSYLLGNDVAMQMPNATTVQVLLYDGHGSSRGLLTPDGQVVENYDYDAFGVMLSSGAGLGTTRAEQMTRRFLYSGEWWDYGLQMSDNRARPYDVATGRFWQRDPYEGEITDPASLHRYIYTHGNPIMGVDPTGYWTLVEKLAVGGLVGILLSFGFVGPMSATLHGSYGLPGSTSDSFIRKHKSSIQQAADVFRLEPEYLAAFIAAEMNDLNFGDYTTDYPLGLIGLPTHAGVAQLSDANLQQMGYDWNWINSLNTRLNPEASIALLAELLRFRADNYSKSFLLRDTTGASWADHNDRPLIHKASNTYRGPNGETIELMRFRDHSSSWSPEMRRTFGFTHDHGRHYFSRIGDEGDGYLLDMRYKNNGDARSWGIEVHRQYNNIKSSGVFR